MLVPVEKHFHGPNSSLVSVIRLLLKLDSLADPKLVQATGSNGRPVKLNLPGFPIFK